VGNSHSIFVEKYEGMMPLGISRCAVEGNVKMEFKEIESEDVYWTLMVRD
jgi:hypothetical protein